MLLVFFNTMPIITELGYAHEALFHPTKKLIVARINSMIV